MRRPSPDLLDAEDRAARDLASFLPFTRDIHDNQVAVPRRLGIDPDVSRPAVAVAHGEHNLRIPRARPERIACRDHGPWCALQDRAASAAVLSGLRLRDRSADRAPLAGVGPLPVTAGYAFL